MIEGQSSTGDGCARSAEENSMTTPRRALVLIDVQQEYFGGPLEIQYPPHAESLPKITAAIDVANDEGLPVVVVQHTMGVGAPVFDPEQSGFQLHPGIDRRRTGAWKAVVKQYGSIYAGTDVAEFLREQGWGHCDARRLHDQQLRSRLRRRGRGAWLPDRSTRRCHRRDPSRQRSRVRRRRGGAHHADDPA